MSEKQVMTAPIIIRHEQKTDYRAIYDLTKRAFAPMPYAGGDEQDLITTLRDGGALVLSLVAVEDEHIVGHIAFSTATSADGAPNWFALGPVSVSPELQRMGIGAKLILAGLHWLKDMQASGCILTGNPKYYARFGFLHYPALAPECEPSQYFMILPMAVTEPSSIMAFHPLFYSQGAGQH